LLSGDGGERENYQEEEAAREVDEGELDEEADDRAEEEMIRAEIIAFATEEKDGGEGGDELDDAELEEVS
jgi:hypothetical protein